MGDRFHYWRAAGEALRKNGLTPLRTSSLYETEPWGGVEGGWFLNAVFEIELTADPESFLSRLFEIEKTLNRVRIRGLEPRTCDLDLLLWGNAVIRSERLEVPHPRLHLRKFVLAPLSELIEERLHPVLGETIADLLHRCTDSMEIRRIEPEGVTGKS